MRGIIAQVQTRVDLVGRRALPAGAFLGCSFGISQRWSEAAAEAAADAKRKAGIFGDDSTDRDECRENAGTRQPCSLGPCDDLVGVGAPDLAASRARRL